MKTLLIPARYTDEIKLGKEILAKIKDAKKVAIFYSVQFENLDLVKEQLSDKKIITTKQILGCDVYPSKIEQEIMKEADAIIYIGDGMFHPKALLLAQIPDIKQVIIWNPLAKVMKTIGKDEILSQIKRMKANLLKYVNAKTVGIIVTTKPGQQKIKQALDLKEKLKDKKAYIFIADTIDFSHLENYPFIEAWVNTACPRIGMDDITNIEKPVINIVDAMDPIKALKKFDN